ncbi:GGDEF domain-containing protein [Methylococcus sp. Mc7]|nr:GGDEF domain-containing protein [Methylococcus sp. Mc7]
MDIFTLLTIIALVCYGKAGVIFLIASQYPPRLMRAMRCWALGVLMMGTDFGLLVLSDLGLIPESPALGSAVTLGVGGALLVFVAVQEIQERSYSKTALTVSVLLTAAMNAYVLYLGSAELRIVINSALSSMVTFLIAFALLRSAPQSGRSIYRVTGTLTVVVGLVWGIRSANPLFLHHPILSPLSDNWLQQVTFTVLLVGTGIMSLCFGLIFAEELNAELHQLASFDALTRIYNRRVFEDLAGEELARARIKREPVSLLMIDIDHFKQVNDRFGHVAGDVALHRIAEIMAGCLRRMDLFCRYGGEEFCALLPATPREEATAIAERLRVAAMETRLRYGETEIPLTVSVGVACIDQPPFDLTAIKQHADRALYTAKHTGRNRVAVAGYSGSPVRDP